MNYEKTYKEAIESIKRIYEQADSFGKELMEKELHELRESEDERIKNEIIAFVEQSIHRGGGTPIPQEQEDKWIVWLEKQGEHANFRNMIQVGDKVTKNEDGVLVNLSQLKRVAKPSEKQGEQKPADKVDVLMSLDEAIEHCKEKSCGNSACALEHEQLEKWLTELKELKEQKSIEQDTETHDLWVYIREWNEKFGRLPKEEDELAACIDYMMKMQKPADKAEPKFKVGDWVVYNRDDYSKEIIQVYDIRDGRYYFTDNIHFSWSIKECDEKCHLWAIQDANDGDVLATKKGNPFIYDKNRYNNGLAYYYAGLDVNKELTLKSPHHMLAHFGELSSVFPATKEQRDLLFQKMEEAGYEWDAEKKELKKTPNSLEECEIEHIEHGKYYYCIKDYYSGGYKRASKGEVVQALRGMNMMGLGVRANEYFIPVKRIVDVRPAWSEEDEEIVEALNEYVKNLDIFFSEIKIGDKDILSKEFREKVQSWLKSLKAQNYWKPSEEQMNALDKAKNSPANYYDIRLGLQSLYNDLLKL